MLYPLNLSFSLSLLFMGFLFANLFGIITSTKSIVFIFILCIELINCFVYTHAFACIPLYPFGVQSKKGIFPSRTFGVRVKKVRVFQENTGYSFDDDKTKRENGIIKEPFSSDSRGIKDSLSFASRGNTKIFNYAFSFALSYAFTILNFLKIGFEFGFFVDAFKLGS